MSAAGLSALYEALARAATRLGLDGLAVAVDDPDLGHQGFAAGSEARTVLTDLVADPTLRWCARPAPADPPAEVETLRALAATALRLGQADPSADPGSALEVLVRGLPHITRVLRTGALVEIAVAPGHHDEVVGRLAATDFPVGAAIVLLATDVGAADGDGTWATQGRAELIDVRTVPETGELEVHLGGRAQRTIGRGPLAGAGQAAATATLEALAGLEAEGPLSARWRVGWVRTIDTTPDRQFLVAVMIQRGIDRSLYGLAAGSSPVEAAARATLHACNRTLGRPRPE